jgi:flagellar export protein FliJ
VKGLRTLIRLRKQDLDELRRDMATLEGRRAALIARREMLDREFAEEQRFVAETPNMAFAYGAYAQRVIAEREDIAARKQALEADMAALGERVAEAFAELKKYEIAMNQRLQRQRAEAARREQRDLDELGLNMHRRRNAS